MFGNRVAAVIAVTTLAVSGVSHAAPQWTQIVGLGTDHPLWVDIAPNERGASQDQRVRYLYASGGCVGHSSPAECDEQKIEILPMVVDCSAGTATVYFSTFGKWRRLKADPITLALRVCN